MTHVLKIIGLCLACLTASAAQAAELKLAAPVAMVESGFLKHILPRFKLKHRISVVPVAPDAAADLALTDGPPGKRVFAARDGTEFRLQILNDSAEAQKFHD